MDRRYFIKNMIALCAAPAIVKADNIMKIWVPSEARLLTFAELHARDRAILFGRPPLTNSAPFAEDDNTTIFLVSWGQEGGLKISPTQPH